MNLPPVQSILRSLAFYIAFYVGGVWFILASAMLYALGSHRRFRRMVEGWSGYHRACVQKLLGITIRIEGKPPEGAVLVAIRHESFFEAIDVPTLLDHPVVFAKAELMRLPFWGRVADRYGVVEVEREQGATALRRMLSAARRLTAEGRPLVIFPEGTRIAHGARQPLQAGFAGLYKLLGLPVVPVAVNSGPLYQRLWKRRGTITMRFGDPIPTGLPRDEIEARVIAAINALNPPEAA
jgi:1-acyl-sn-glycerol-3-phosphate acyltransferase